MKIRLIIVTKDKSYAEVFCEGAAAKRDLFDMGICTNYEKLNEMLYKGKYDVALIEREALAYIQTDLVKLTILLWNQKLGISMREDSIPLIKKYQKVSSILAEVQGHYAQVAPQKYSADNNGKIIAVWSPAGGTGKTTIALASALRASLEGKKATYLDLEYFSGTSALLDTNGKSISTVFAHLTGNLAMQMQSIRMEDSNTNISYFCPPSNYDDMNELTEEDMQLLVKAAATGSDSLIVDLPSVCDKKTKAIFDMCDRILLVVDDSMIAIAKMHQFMSQNNVFRTYMSKITVVANKSAKVSYEEEVKVVSLQKMNTGNPVQVYQALSQVRI